MKKRFPRQTAFVYCRGCKKIKEDSQAQESCSYGCIGCGACVSACKLGAIHINKDGIAVVDEKKCVNCGLCGKACPQGIIHSHVVDNEFIPACSNHDFGKAARDVCENSCIGCKLCEKVCPSGAAKVKDHLAVINDNLCLNCGFCAVRCPRNVIIDTKNIIRKKGGTQ